MSDKLIYTMRPAPHPVRQRCCEAVMQVPDGYLVTIQPPKRSLEQNAKMWAMLKDISTQLTHYDLKLSSDDWKVVLSASLKQEIRTVPNIQGNGLVVLGMRTSQMSIGEMNELIAFMDAFGSERGVKWSEPENMLEAL